MIRPGLAALGCLLAGPAPALSCLAPDLARSTAQAVAAEETFRVVIGRFDVDLPPNGTAGRFPARFAGRGVTSDGLGPPVSGEVTIEIGCAGPWCGEKPPETEALAFLRREADAWVLYLGACPQWLFEAPTKAQVETVRSCVAGNCPAG